MALLHADGFGHYASAQYTDVYATGGFGATLAIGAYGPNGRSGLRFTGDYNDSVQRVGLVPSGSGFALQGDFRLSANPPTANVILGVIGSGALQCSLVINTDRTLRAYRGGAGGAALGAGASSYVVPTDTHIHIGFTGTIDNTSGTIEVHVWEDDDTSAQVVLTVTGADTQANVTADWDGVDLGAACSGTTDWANFLIMDASGSALNDLLGPVDCWTLYASGRAASALTAWSLSAGSSIAALLDDATPDDDTTYCEESTQNDQVSVAVDPIPVPGRTIYGAQLYASAKLTSGSPTVKALAYESSTAYLGSDVSPGADYTYVQQPYSAMPSGAAFSTAAAFDALQWGLKLTSAGTTARLTQVAVVVILQREQGRRNLLTGYTHSVAGDDNLVVGQSNAVIGSASQAHGVSASVQALRTVLFGLTGVAVEEIENGVFRIDATKIKFNASEVTVNGSPLTGGTGTVTHTGALTADQVVIGNGTDDLKALGSAGTSTTVLHGNASGPPSFGAVDLANDVSGNLSVSHLNSGTSANSSSFWRGDGQWATPAGASGGGPLFVRKASDESVTSSTSLQDDDDLVFAIGASETWIAEYFLMVTGASAGDIQLAWNVPSGATGAQMSQALVASVGANNGNVVMGFSTDLTDTGVSGVGAVTGGVFIRFTLIIINGANAGSVTLRWAQLSSNGTATTIKANSFLLATRVA